MRKLVLIFWVISAPYFIWANDDGTGNNNGNDSNTIPITSEDFLTEEGRRQIPIFHAEINNDRTILVRADRTSDFVVTILDASGMNVHYHGITINGVLHITTQSFPLGCYTLCVETSVCTYTGEFEISNTLQ